MNKGQRIHLNYVEHLPMLVALSLIAGVIYPIQVAVCGFLYVLARILYAEGYKIRPKLRVAGALLMDLFLIIIIVYGVKVTYTLESRPLAIIVFLLLACLSIGFFAIHPKRKAYFTETFMAQFEKEHKEAFGEDAKVPVGEGYPDMGNGRYSKKLPYDQWFLFNVA